MKRIFFALLGALLVLTACEEETTKRTRVPVHISKPSNQSFVYQGDDFELKITSKDHSLVDEVIISANDTVLYQGGMDEEEMKIIVSSKNWKIGTNQIRLEATAEGLKSRNDNRLIKVLPTTYPTDYIPKVMNVFPHSNKSYTQGLEFDGDDLYEGTGGHGDVGTGESFIAKVDLKTGEHLLMNPLEKKYFGEGITIFGDSLFQLTWREHKCFIRDKNTLEEIGEFNYTGEGWGLTNNGKELIMSDGSERLYFRDPKTFRTLRTIEVYTNEGPISNLNELEYIKGKIYANVYTTNFIVIIDPETGVVTGKIDASLLALDYRDGGEVFNGIAYHEESDKIYVTGKRWPNLMEIELVEE